MVNLLTVVRENDLEKVRQINCIESLINMQTEDDVFPLFEACENGYEAIVKYLVDHVLMLIRKIMTEKHLCFGHVKTITSML